MTASNRRTFLASLGNIATVADRQMNEAQRDRAASPGATHQGPAVRAANNSVEVMIFRAITALRQDWIEPRPYGAWTGRQLRSAELLVAYCLEEDKPRAETHLQTVAEVAFFRKWRNVTLAASRSAKFDADRASFESKYDARKARLLALWEKCRNDTRLIWSHVADKMRAPVPKTPFRAALEQAEAAPWLWHTIATDQHELSADRLSGIFWLMEQPGCDRATAAEFIAGFLPSQNYRRAAQSAAQGSTGQKCPGIQRIRRPVGAME